ncbi:uncharacterized protein LOC111831581 [Capsella rubella]|uniref:uncharacterized protein LOC111831581 n=1 Tax=Capsella rubella TaxID=81985 RepID=UPI000CD4CAEB|nr:uncharacterized protein LOC111831581 [Capsella rubella]
MAAVNIQDGVSDDFDYEHWAPITRKKLVENGVWDVVQNGVSPNPTKIPALAATIEVVDLAQWRNRVIKDNKALKIMQSSLPDSVFRKTISVASSKDLWDLLQKGNDNEEAKLRRLEKQFENLMMWEGEPIDLYLDRVLHLVEQFRSSGNAKSDDQVIAKLFTSLSWSYDDAIPVLEELMNLPDMILRDLLGVLNTYGDHPETMPRDLKDVIKRLRKCKSEQTWCGVCKKYNHYQEDCYYNPRVVDLSGGRGQCFQCGERGHYARDCGNVRTATQAKLDRKREVKDDFTYDEDMWMLYTTTANHMTPYEKFFTTLDRTYRAGVQLADGNVVMVEGIGDVMFMMNGVRMTIKDVLFVPRVNRNVLSFSRMGKRGFSMEMAGGECTIRYQTGKIFVKTMREKRGIALRLEVIKRYSL